MFFLFLMMLGLFLSSLSSNDFPKGFLYFHIISLLFILSSFFISYQFEIKDDYLIYQILFLNKAFYKRVIKPEQITKITFARYGWATKGAIIKIQNQLSVRIYRLEPKNVFFDLNEFATRNSIPTVKTKDYLILERMR